MYKDLRNYFSNLNVLWAKLSNCPSIIVQTGDGGPDVCCPQRTSTQTLVTRHCWQLWDLCFWCESVQRLLGQHKKNQRTFRLYLCSCAS